MPCFVLIQTLTRIPSVCSNTHTYSFGLFKHSHEFLRFVLHFYLPGRGAQAHEEVRQYARTAGKGSSALVRLAANEMIGAHTYACMHTLLNLARRPHASLIVSMTSLSHISHAVLTSHFSLHISMTSLSHISRAILTSNISPLISHFISA
jgi:hypothetical protein